MDLDIQPIPANGFGAAHLDDPGQYGRITAVLVNADPSQSGFDNGNGDWIWTRDASPSQRPDRAHRHPAQHRWRWQQQRRRRWRWRRRRRWRAGTTEPVALTSKFSLKKTQKLAGALKKGVLTNVQCSQACTVKVELRLDAKTAKKLKLKRVVGTKTVTLTNAGTRAVRVKLNKKARGKFKKRKSTKLTAVMRATSAGSAAKQRTAKVTLKR